MQSRLIPIQAAPSAEPRKPPVTVLFEQSRSTDCRDLIANLNVAFTCSARCLAATPATAPVCDAELVIWQRAGAGRRLHSDAAMALAGVPPACPLIVIAENTDAVEFDLLGRNVADFVVSPYSSQELILRARRVLGLLEPVAVGQERAAASRIEAIVVGNSAVLTREVEKLKRFAACDAGVLILGETGTGKEVFAQATHYMSARAARPMVAVNCGAVPAELVEAELFGHVKGAYTNAHISRTGLVSEAERGTLFLDDVDCLPLSAQAKLLRFLQEREYRVVGSNAVQHADVRVIAASNRDLAAMAREGTFRDDLFYRLNVLTLSLPPLREHKEDIVALSQHFLRQFAQRYQRTCCNLLPGALLKLLSYHWPGNIRELSHVLERAALLSPACTLDARDIDLPVAAPDPVPTEEFQAMKARVVQSFERSYIESILSSTNGNVTEAARLAGKNRRALFELIRKHEITPASFRPAANY
jgi:two-component system response regulator GlrR